MNSQQMAPLKRLTIKAWRSPANIPFPRMGAYGVRFDTTGGSEEVVDLMISIKGDELTLTSTGSSGAERYRREK